MRRRERRESLAGGGLGQTLGAPLPIRHADRLAMRVSPWRPSSYGEATINEFGERCYNDPPLAAWSQDSVGSLRLTWDTGTM